MEKFFEYEKFKKECTAANSQEEIATKIKFIEQFVDEFMLKNAVNERIAVINIRFLFDLGRDNFPIFPYNVQPTMEHSNKYSVRRACSNISLDNHSHTDAFLVFTKI